LTSAGIFLAGPSSKSVAGAAFEPAYDFRRTVLQFVF
jgi:hypothetical protein